MLYHLGTRKKSTGLRIIAPTIDADRELPHAAQQYYSLIRYEVGIRSRAKSDQTADQRRLDLSL